MNDEDRPADPPLFVTVLAGLAMLFASAAFLGFLGGFSYAIGEATYLRIRGI